jgi:23S rRNA (uridine2552-2'-O)-methyltransferase
MTGRGGGGGRRTAGSAGGFRTTLRRSRRRKASSTRWLERQLNDPYVAEAKAVGYRSRAAFKLAELDARFRFLRRGKRVIDLGAAPGGWTQVAVERVGDGNVVAVDINEIAAIPGAIVLQLDVSAPGAMERIREAIGGRADVVLSDMAPSTTGHRATDHLRIVALAESAFKVACDLLEPGGTFVAKVFQGGAEGSLLAALKRAFSSVRHAKPPASRAESPETYVVATGFRGGADPDQVE